MNTHPEQWAAFYTAAPGALLKGSSVVVLNVERALDIHSPHLQFLPARDSNSQPFDYKSDSLTQGWGMLILEGHSPAEFSFNPEKTWKKIPDCILKTLISWFRCVWFGFGAKLCRDTGPPGSMFPTPALTIRSRLPDVYYTWDFD